MAKSGTKRKRRNKLPDEFQTNHLLNNEESIEIHLITWLPLQKGKTAGGHVIQMALFLKLRQSGLPFHQNLHSSFFLFFKFLNQLILELTPTAPSLLLGLPRWYLLHCLQMSVNQREPKQPHSQINGIRHIWK